MAKFAVALIDSAGSNDLTVEIVEAESETEAVWKHSELPGNEWAEFRKETRNSNLERLKRGLFNYNVLVDVVKID